MEDQRGSRERNVPPTIQRIAGPWRRHSASFTSSYPARRPNTDCRSKPTSAWRPFPAGSRITECLARHLSQAECIVEFAVCQQSRVGRDHGPTWTIRRLRDLCPFMSIVALVCAAADCGAGLLLPAHYWPASASERGRLFACLAVFACSCGIASGLSLISLYQSSD
jgi:hypothetical protein